MPVDSCVRAATTTTQHSLQVLHTGLLNYRDLEQIGIRSRCLGSASLPGIGTPSLLPLTVSPCLFHPYQRHEAWQCRQTDREEPTDNQRTTLHKQPRLLADSSNPVDVLTLGKFGLHRHTPLLLHCTVILRHFSTPLWVQDVITGRSLLTRRGLLHWAVGGTRHHLATPPTDSGALLLG